MAPGLLADWQRCVFLHGQEEPGLRRIPGHFPTGRQTNRQTEQQQRAGHESLPCVHLSPGTDRMRPFRATCPDKAPSCPFPWERGEQLQPSDGETEARGPFCPGSAISLEPGHGLILWGQLGAPGWPGLGVEAGLAAGVCSLSLGPAAPLGLAGMSWPPASKASPWSVCWDKPAGHTVCFWDGSASCPVTRLSPLASHHGEVRRWGSWVFPTSQCLCWG